MGQIKWITGAVCALVVAGVTASTFAAPAMPWTNTNGVAITWMWSDGGSDNGLFGDPVLVGDQIVFFPQNFRAESSNGVSDQVIDRLEVTIMAMPGQTLEGFELHELGDYGIFTQGSVNAEANLFLTRLDPPPVAVETASMVTNPVFPVNSGSGIWDGSVDIDLTGQGWTKMTVVLNNILQANSEQGSSSFIEKKFAGVRIKVPEPTTGLLLAGLSVALGGMRLRRHA